MTTKMPNKTSDAAASSWRGSGGDSRPSVAVAQNRQRRSRAQWALALALIALGGLLAAVVVTRLGHTHSVLAMSNTVQRGSVINADDLTTASINSDPALDTIPASQKDDIVGKYAADDLAAGSTLTQAEVTTSQFPSKGQSVVGLALTSGQLPATALRPGDPARIVLVANAQTSGAATTGPPSTIAATIVDTHTTGGSDGQTVVDVSVTSANAPTVAAASAGGHIALVLDSGN